MKLGSTTSPEANQQALHKASAQLESFLVKQLLSTSGAFKGNSEVAGSSITHELFADTLAQVVSENGGMGLASLIERSLDQGTPTGTAAGGDITSNFGERLDPITHQPSTHSGVDLGAAEGTPIPAARDGVVIAAGPRGGYGNAVEIAHADGTSTLYAHASEVMVTPGMSVREGEIVGLVGQTGRTTGPHLHFELRKGGHFVDPGVALKAYRLRAEKVGGGEP
jgi:murein DD-endopeptidase MepM/ murein hydrolase activator NlpD